MEEQTPRQPEGEGTPTPEEGMSPQDQTPETPESTPQDEATPEEDTGGQAPDNTPDPVSQVFEEAGITGVDSREAAIQKIKGLNSLVGDQTVATQRQIVAALEKQTGMSQQEILNALSDGGNAPIYGSQNPQSPQTQDNPALERTIRLEADTFAEKEPAAEKVKDRLIQRMKDTGLSAREVWKAEFEPLVSVGKTEGAKRLQSNTKGQPAAGGSTTDIQGKQKKIPAAEKYKGKSAAEMKADLMKSRPSAQ